MKVELLVTADCPPCDEARAVWEQVCRELGHAFDIVREDNSITVCPAVKIEGRIVAVGVQSADQARALLDRVSRTS